MNKRMTITIIVGLTLLSSCLAGCISDDGGEEKYKDPKMVGKVSINDEDILVDEEGRSLTVDIVLFYTDDPWDISGKQTRADGVVRLVLVDAEGFEMLNRTYEAHVADFGKQTYTVMSQQVSFEEVFRMEVAFSEMEKSPDRGYGWSYPWLDGEVTFEWKDQNFTCGLDGCSMPEALIVPNTYPTAVLEGPAEGWVGQTLTFDASGSTDPENEAADIQLDRTWYLDDDELYEYYWTFEYPSWSPGTYEVMIEVMDAEEETDSATMQVSIADPFVATVQGVGIIDEPGDHFNDTYVDLEIGNVADVEVLMSGYDYSYNHHCPAPILVNAVGGTLDDNGTDITMPDTLGAHETITLRVYFATEDFEAEKVRLWDRIELALP